MSFAIGAKRTRPLMTAAHAPGQAWVPAIGMEHTEIAIIDYLPEALFMRNAFAILVVMIVLSVAAILVGRRLRRRVRPVGEFNRR